MTFRLALLGDSSTRLGLVHHRLVECFRAFRCPGMALALTLGRLSFRIVGVLHHLHT